MQVDYLNGFKAYSFSSKDELINFALAEKKSLIALNAEKILTADKTIKNFVNNNIGYCDGVGAVLALRKKGNKYTIKIPGCELWLDIIRQTFKEKSFYFIGAKPEVIEETIKKLNEEFKGIRVLNYRNGYLRNNSDVKSVLQDIISKKPDIIFVAMGSPKQEMLMEELQKNYSAVYQGLGGSFDVYSGYSYRAPDWWVRNNLEWAYRLFKQPKRILRQYVYVIFLYKMILNQL